MTARTLEEILDGVSWAMSKATTDNGKKWTIEQYVREAFAAGAASRASSEDERKRIDSAYEQGDEDGESSAEADRTLAREERASPEEGRARDAERIAFLRREGSRLYAVVEAARWLSEHVYPPDVWTPEEVPGDAEKHPTLGTGEVWMKRLNARLAALDVATMPPAPPPEETATARCRTHGARDCGLGEYYECGCPSAPASPKEGGR